MKELAIKFNEEYDSNFDFSFSVMLIKTSIFHCLEPAEANSLDMQFVWKGRRFSFFGKVLKVVWDHGSNGIPPNYRMTLNQGICGKAFQEGKETNTHNIVGVTLLAELLKGHNFKLNEMQKKSVQGIVIVASCPLVIKDKGVDRQRKEVIGVLNVESRSFDSARLLLDENARKIFFQKITNVANIYLNLH
ncbi:hypothetical protein L3C95_20770 [Chitinophaga filiformis]|uniref:hypothetical protein n=1 Tax=Chitinophaga filiformis TaxID=104663 RepID=UPI001F178D6B|nr:hypothetical protein [Chitinophaga filiformis]MCF6405351.1 hypothetical protein [Chitinophaga filiformis]